MKNTTIYECEPENSCVKLNKCNKYCEQRLGEQLISLLKNTEIFDSHIGSYEESKSSTGNSKKDYKVYGCMLESSDIKSLIKLLTDKDSMYEIKNINKFAPIAEKSIKSYLATKIMEPEEKESILSEFNKINGIGKLPLTIKPGTKVLVKYTALNGDDKAQVTTVKLVKWEIDKKTGQLSGKIYCETGRTIDNKSYGIYNFTDYGDTWSMPTAEIGIKTSALAYEMVKMNNYGFVLPVEVRGNKASFAMDAKHVYMITKNKAYPLVIGNVSGSEINLINGLDEVYDGDKAFEKIKWAFKFMNKHKRIIIPYGAVEPHVVEA